MEPVEMIKSHMEAMGWNQSDLAALTGYSHSRVSEFLNYKRKLTLQFIRAYHRYAPTKNLEVLIADYDLR